MEQVSDVPYPLYRSGGVTGTWAQRVDQEVNIALNATERTTSEFKTLVEKAGLKLESIVQPRSRHGMVTAVLALILCGFRGLSHSQSIPQSIHPLLRSRICWNRPGGISMMMAES